jgi:hypothetical protein
MTAAAARSRPTGSCPDSPSRGWAGGPQPTLTRSIAVTLAGCRRPLTATGEGRALGRVRRRRMAACPEAARARIDHDPAAPRDRTSSSRCRVLALGRTWASPATRRIEAATTSPTTVDSVIHASRTVTVHAQTTISAEATATPGQRFTVGSGSASEAVDEDDRQHRQPRANETTSARRAVRPTTQTHGIRARQRG